MAIRIAASRLAARSSWTVTFLSHKLSDERRRLKELAVGDLAITTTFTLGYRQLAPEYARAFRLLAVPDGPDICLDAAAAALALTPHAAEQLLESLVDWNLLESPAVHRYRYHDLLHLYARDRAEHDETEHTRDAVLSQLLDFYLACTVGYFKQQHPGDRAADHLVQSQHVGLDFPDRACSVEWLFSHALHLLGAVEQAANARRPPRAAVDLLFAAQDLAESGAYLRRYQQAGHRLVDATSGGDPLVEGRARLLLGRAYNLSRQPGPAATEAEHALLLGYTAEDPLTISYALTLQGLSAYEEESHARATAYHSAALEAFRSDDNRYGEAGALCNLARAHTALGDPSTAEATARQALDIYREINPGFRTVMGLYALANALTQLGKTDEAITHLTTARSICHTAGMSVWEAQTLHRIAEAHLAANNPSSAVDYAEQALPMLRQLNAEWEAAQVLRLLRKARKRIEATEEDGL